MSKKETESKTPEMPFMDLFQVYNNDNYQQYTKQWLDAWDTYNTQMISFQKMMIERTGQAWDEAYKMAREGLNRSAQLIDLYHSVGTSQMKQFRNHFNY